MEGERKTEKTEKGRRRSGRQGGKVGKEEGGAEGKREAGTHSHVSGALSMATAPGPSFMTTAQRYQPLILLP